MIEEREIIQLGGMRDDAAFYPPRVPPGWQTVGRSVTDQYIMFTSVRMSRTG